MATLTGPWQWLGQTALSTASGTGLSSGFRSAGLLLVAGVPVHTLIVAVVAVLLPLAALCSIGMAVHGGFRRRFGSATLVLTAIAVAAVPLAQFTGMQLAARVGTAGPLVTQHVRLGNDLLPYALGFGVAVVVLLVAGKLADRERAAEENTAKTWQRMSLALSVIVVAMAGLTTVEVVRIGTTGAQAVWIDKTR